MHDSVTHQEPQIPSYTFWYRIYRDNYYTGYTHKTMQHGKGRPLVTVCVLTVTETTGSRQYMGYSICSPRDTPHLKRGRMIATARAKKAYRLGIPCYIYKQGLGKTPRRVLAACGLRQCVYRAMDDAGDWLCLPLRVQNTDAGNDGSA